LYRAPQSGSSFACRAPGEILEFEEDNGRLVAVKTPGQAPLTAVYGMLRSQGETRGLRLIEPQSR